MAGQFGTMDSRGEEAVNRADSLTGLAEDGDLRAALQRVRDQIVAAGANRARDAARNTVQRGLDAYNEYTNMDQTMSDLAEAAERGQP